MAKAKFIGVYASTKVPVARGEGAAKAQKRHWFAWEDGWGRFRVQLLDPAFQPVEAPRALSAEEFKHYFEHQPHILVTPVTQLEVAPPEPDEMEMEMETDARPPSPSRGKIADIPLSSKLEADTGPVRPLRRNIDKKELEQAAELDRQLRSEFAIALARWRRGDKVTPLKVFETMCAREEGIVPAHKHMFTDFAIDLRKSSLTALALQHYQKAVDLAPEDSNAHFNLARICYETGKLDKAEEHLLTALELSPDFTFASRFLQVVRTQREQPASGKKR